MDFELLEPDELMVEYQIRNLNPHEEGALQKLQDVLFQEVAGVRAVPTKTHAEFRSLNSELSAVGRKVVQLGAEVHRLVSDEPDDRMLRTVCARVVHLQSRLNRAKPLAGYHAQVGRLEADLDLLAQRTQGLFCAAGTMPPPGAGALVEVASVEKPSIAAPSDDLQVATVGGAAQGEQAQPASRESGSLPSAEGDKDAQPNLLDLPPRAPSAADRDAQQQQQIAEQQRQIEQLQLALQHQAAVVPPVQSLQQPVPPSLRAMGFAHAIYGPEPNQQELVRDFPDLAGGMVPGSDLSLPPVPPISGHVVPSFIDRPNQGLLPPAMPNPPPRPPNVLIPNHPIYPAAHHHRDRVYPPSMPPPHQPGVPSGLANGWTMMKWPLRFGGGVRDLPVEEFLFRVETLARVGNVSQAALTFGLHQILSDSAATWYWVYIREHPNATWQQVKEALTFAYRSSVTDAAIRRQISDRLQRQGERFMDYCLAVQELAVRLRRRMSNEELLEVLQRNMAPAYQERLLFHQVATLHELQDLCQRVEEMWRGQNEVHQARRPQPRGREIAALEDMREAARYNHWPVQPPSSPWWPSDSVYESQPPPPPQPPAPQYPAYAPAACHAPPAAPQQMPFPELVESSGGQILDEQQYWVCAMEAANRREYVICWNCDDMGHTYIDCPAARKIFCFSCGTKNVVRPQCPRCAVGTLQGNGWRNGQASQMARGQPFRPHANAFQQSQANPSIPPRPQPHPIHQHPQAAQPAQARPPQAMQPQQPQPSILNRPGPNVPPK